MKACVCLILLLMLSLPLKAAEPAFSVQSAYLIDPDNRFTPEALGSAAFKAFQGDLRLGFRHGAVWIRLDAAPTQRAPDRGYDEPSDMQAAVIRVAPFGLDSVELHRISAGHWIREEAGDLLARRHRSLCPDDTHCFVLREPPAAGFTAYLRVESRGNLLISADVLSQDELSTMVTRRLMRTAASMTVAVMLLMMGLVLLADQYRSMMVLAYCGFQMSILLFLSAVSGLLPDLLAHWSAQAIDQATHYIYLLRVAMASLLCFAVMQRHDPPALYRRLWALLMLATGANALILWSGDVRLALQVNNAIFLANGLIHLYGSATARDLSTRYRWIQGVAYLTYVLLAGIGTALAYGLLDTEALKGLPSNFGDWRLNGLPFGLVFFLFLLIERSATKAKQYQELETLRLQLTEARSNEEKLRERQGLIDMLTHELKTPLATIRFALSSLQRGIGRNPEASGRIQNIETCVARMNDFIEHVAASNRVELSEASAGAVAIRTGALIQEVIDEYPDPRRFDIRIEDGAEIRTDRQMLTVLLENLIRNAYQYGVSTEAIEIAVACRDSSTRIDITNAVSAERRPDTSRLFERYYRHPNVLGVPGSGLGLSVAKLAAQKIGASLAFELRGDLIRATVRLPS